MNDDASLSIAATSATKSEGNSGNTAFTFDVTLSSAASGPVTVNYATANGTAILTAVGTDRMALSGRFLNRRPVKKIPIEITPICIGKPTVWKKGIPKPAKAPTEKSVHHSPERAVRTVAKMIGFG